MYVLRRKLNIFSSFKKFVLSPSDWIDNYWDEFFSEAFLITKDKKISQIIVENTFSKGIVKRNEFYGNEDEHSWLLKILCNEIKAKSNTLFKKSNFSLFYQKCLDRVSYIEKEAFRLKMYKKEKTKDICKKLNINEEQFWKHIHNMRVSLIHIR